MDLDAEKERLANERFGGAVEERRTVGCSVAAVVSKPRCGLGRGERRIRINGLQAVVIVELVSFEGVGCWKSSRWS